MADSDIIQGVSSERNSGPGMFRVMGLLACMLRGEMRKFAVLCGQAVLETADHTSKAWRNNGGAWCIHYSPTGTPRANAVYTTANGERVAAYDSSWGSWLDMFRMWNDRLDWDERNGIKYPTGTLNDDEGYMRAIVDSHWLGRAPDEARKRRYFEGWKASMAKVPGWVKAVSGMNWYISYLVLLVIIVLVMYPPWKWRKRKRNG